MFFCYIDPGSGFTILGGIGGFLSALLLPFLIGIGVYFKKILRFFFRHKKFTIPLVLVVLIVFGISMGAFMKHANLPFDKKIFILGMDGLSPEILDRLMAEEKLPNFSRCRERWAYSRISTTNPSQSPVAWTGFSTGKNPGKHGVCDFIKRYPDTYRLELATTQIRNGKVITSKKEPSFWQYMADLGIPTTVLWCPVTFPPEKLSGRMISGMGTPDILGTQGTFSFYTTEPLAKDADVGGKVFSVSKEPVKLIHIQGPRIISGGKKGHLTIPCKVTADEANDAAAIDIQRQHIRLQKGQWSGWVSVTFRAGLFRRVHGIVRFYLVETSPHFKLYVSPINMDPRKPYFPITYPSAYGRELADAVGLFYTQGMPCDTWAVNEGRLTEKPLLEQIDEVLRENRAILDYELNRFKNGVLYCYFEAPDIVQHMFWRYIDHQHPLYDEAGARTYGDTIYQWYQKMDAILGEVMEKVSDDDLLIVLSDHGFNTFRRAIHVNTWLRQNGYLELLDPRASSGRELLADIDWSKTKAYAIGFGSIYINQVGRESKGIVKPGRETEALKKELAEKLLTWQDPAFGAPILNAVYLKETIFWGPLTEEMPDLYLGTNIGYRASWQTAMGGVPNGLMEDNLKKWSGDHLFDPQLIPGILFVNRLITKKDPSLYDITPTILKFAGMDDEVLKGCDFDGAPLF